VADWDRLFPAPRHRLEFATKLNLNFESSRITGSGGNFVSRRESRCLKPSLKWTCADAIGMLRSLSVSPRSGSRLRKSGLSRFASAAGGTARMSGPSNGCSCCSVDLVSIQYRLTDLSLRLGLKWLPYFVKCSFHPPPCPSTPARAAL